MDKRDFVYRVGSSTNVIGRPPYFYSSDKLHVNGARFASVYAVRVEDAYAIQETAGTAAGFKGIVWSQRLWIDFDTYEAADVAERWLKEQGYDYVSYDTGGRGRHVGVLRDADPSHTLPDQDRRWVEENIKGADLSLYWHLHLIRLPGTLHERTGKPKQLKVRVTGRSVEAYDSTERSVTAKTSRDYSTDGDSIFSSWDIMQLLQGCIPEGRHAHLVRLAYMAQVNARIGPDETFWLLSEVNKQFQEGPKSEEEVRRIAEWACSGEKYE